MSNTSLAGRPGVALLYREVKKQLIADIQSGTVPPGGALPNESDLAKRFQVSIGTVRRAVDELVADHILVRQQGRGTFVRRLDRERFMFQFFKIAARDGTREFPQVQLHSFSKSRATAIEAKLLALQVTEPVFRIENILSLQGQPVIHDQIVIAAARFPGLSKRLFEQRSGTIYELYQSSFGLTIVGTQERVRAEAASPSSADLLGLSAGDAVLRIERLALSFGNQPTEFRISIVNTQGFDYVASEQASV